MLREMVPRAGVEPARLAARDFKSRASTNFATRAAFDHRLDIVYSDSANSLHLTAVRNGQACFNFSQASAPPRNAFRCADSLDYTQSRYREHSAAHSPAREWRRRPSLNAGNPDHTASRCRLG